jgi:hypothetical protein
VRNSLRIRRAAVLRMASIDDVDFQFRPIVRVRCQKNHLASPPQPVVGSRRRAGFEQTIEVGIPVPSEKVSSLQSIHYRLWCLSSFLSGQSHPRLTMPEASYACASPNYIRLVESENPNSVLAVVFSSAILPIGHRPVAQRLLQRAYRYCYAKRQNGEPNTDWHCKPVGAGSVRLRGDTDAA